MKYIYNQWISSHFCWKCAINNGQCREKNKKLCKVKKGWRKRSHAIQWQDWILSSFMMLCLIFHTAFIINRKNWRITIKFHFKNLSIFLKSERKLKLGPPPPRVRFCSFFNDAHPLPLLSSMYVLFEWPLNIQWVTKISEALYCQLTCQRFVKSTFLKLWTLF